MYFGNKYTSTISTPVESEFYCKACGFRQACIVSGIGMGVGNSAYFLNNAGAKMKSEERASTDALKNAELTLKLCPCPQCGKSERGQFIVNSILYLVGLGLGILAFVLIFYYLTKSMIFVWAFVFFGLFALVFAYYNDIHWKWSTAQDRITFLKNE